jgi:hypothetical protein
VFRFSILLIAISLPSLAWAAVPVVESYVDSTAANDTCVVRSPASVASGEVVLLIISARENNPEANNLITPSGFTLIAQDRSNATDVSVAAFYKVSAGSEPSTYRVANVGNDVNNHAIWALRISGNHGTPLEATGTLTGQVSDSIHCAAVTTTNDSCLAFYWVGFDGNDGLPMTENGTGWSEEVEVQFLTISAAWGTKSMPTNGSTGLVYVDPNSTSDGNWGGQFAIRGTYVGAAGPSAQMIIIQQ